MEQNLKDRIKGIVDAHPVVLFMKGNRSLPQCGFSARAVDVLQRAGAEFESVDILADPELRNGLKEYSNWPTFPQCYLRGQFIGGSDILVQMLENGELKKMVDPNPPSA